MRKHFGIKSTLGAGMALLAGALLGGLSLYAYMSNGGLLPVTTGADGDPGTAGIRRASFGPAVEFLGYSDSLDKQRFDNTNVGGLSALAYDPRRGLYYALVDREKEQPARFYTLHLPLEGAELGKPEVFDVTVLRDPEGRPFGAGRFDGEGIAVTSWGDLLVSSETEPSVRRFSPDGRLLQELPVPEKFLVAPQGGGRPNNTFEGLSLTPDGDSLFVALQKPLEFDNRSSEKQQRIRLLRYENQGAEGFQPSEEFFYLTDSQGGVSEIAAVSEEEILVLESGNKVFRADLSGAENISDKETLADPALKPLKKEYVADLDSCVPDSASGSRADPPAGIYYEGMALGPSLAGEGRALLFVSDDNFDDAQVTRVMALGAWPQPSPEKTARRVCK